MLIAMREICNPGRGLACCISPASLHSHGSWMECLLGAAYTLRVESKNLETRGAGSLLIRPADAALSLLSVWEEFEALGFGPSPQPLEWSQLRKKGLYDWCDTVKWVPGSN